MIKRPRKWHGIIAVLSLITIFLSSSLTAKADAPFDTFSVNGFGRTIFTQPAYEPSEAMAQDINLVNEKGEKVFSPLSSPQDLFIDQNDEIYIADSGNNRIVHLNENGELVRVLLVPESPLKQPSGIFVATNGDIYVADTGNKRVIRLNKDGKLIKEYLRPESKYINKSFVYEPINMVVDRRGFVYVVSKGTFQGIVQFNPEGEFYGFYGTNVTEVSLMDKVRKLLYTEEQLKRQVRLLPNPIRNIDIDSNGYIYTVSRESSKQIKKLNIRGENQWKDFSFGKNINLNFLRKRATNPTEGEGSPAVELTDITVDQNGIVTVVDRASAVVAQFNQNGELLFYWGAPVNSGTPQMGVTISPAAIDTNSKNKIFILDQSQNLIQVLKPTEFGAAIQSAYILTQQGKYSDSEQYWSEISRQNALFSPAYEGLARAAFYREDFEGAQELYKLAGEEKGYSDSFWQLRLNWFQKNFPIFANSFLVLSVTTLVGVQVQRRRKSKRKKIAKKNSKLSQIKLIQQLKHAFYILKHPIDGFADIRFREMGGYVSALIILVLVISMVLVRIYFTSFTFQPVPIESISVNSILTVSSVVWVSWVICQYLIGSIRYGQARFKDIFVGSAYALFPVFLFGLPLALLSNVMTLNESSIYGFFNALMVIWSAALFFWMVQTLQNYSVGETIVNILLTLFSMIMLWVLVFIVLGLSSETIEFIFTLYQEVTM
ncbi:YIP1 family protein [Lederbergia wuyishanensis]|uniref:Sugar lactone lactonase YvrE n=1 Tax=Lederbergia wuyishanensis TaxID=1347903 RepID=A0ABU0D989_9BACI|nr:YIP1 family protein [Lederbergia wuyishanensis]MCJ8009413.1 PknD [Lederbergia wuyishanensis]MDQ0344978.1 sugar lactone lactonase YvrE [Lederbergia wuyishanensis]